MAIPVEVRRDLLRIELGDWTLNPKNGCWTTRVTAPDGDVTWEVALPEGDRGYFIHRSTAGLYVQQLTVGTIDDAVRVARAMDRAAAAFYGPRVEPPKRSDDLRQAVLFQLFLSFAGGCTEADQDAATDATVVAAGVPEALVVAARQGDERPLWEWLKAWAENNPKARPFLGLFD